MSIKQKAAENRHFIRHPMKFPLEYHVIKRMKTIDAESVSSATINISRGGLLFPAKEPIEINSLIDIKMAFKNKAYSVKAKVVYCTRSYEKKFYNIGVHFQGVHDAFAVRLIEQMYLISEWRQLRSIQLGKDISLQQASQEWIRRFAKGFQKRYW